MNSAAAWVGGVLSLANAVLAAAVLVPMHRARRASRQGVSLISRRMGAVIEGGLLLYAAVAVLRGSLGIAGGLGHNESLSTVQDWGMISGAGSVLLVLAAVRFYLAPMLAALHRSERALGVMLGAVQPDSLDPQNLGLSSREQEVLAVMAAGKTSDQEIADALFISAATAGTHVRNILRKAGLHDRRQLVLIGLQSPEG